MKKTKKWLSLILAVILLTVMSSAIVTVDALTASEIEGLPGFINDTDSRITYTGNWGAGGSRDWQTGAAGGGRAYTGAENDTATLAFTLTAPGRVTVIMSKQNGSGFVNVSVDGGVPVQVNTNSGGATQWAQEVYTSSMMVSGDHTIEVKNINGGYGVGYIYLEGFVTELSDNPKDIIELHPGFIPSYDTRIAYAGWARHWNMPDAAGGDIMYTGTAGATATLNFTLDRSGQVMVVMTKANSHGIVNISVDGGTPVSVNNNNSGTTQFAQTVYTSSVLKSGNHIIEVKNTIQDGYVWLEGFIVELSDEVPDNPLNHNRFINDTDADITYVGNWGAGSSRDWQPEAMGGGRAFNGEELNATATLAFTLLGPGRVEVILTKQNVCGFVDISIDGGAPQRVNANSGGATQWAQTVYASPALMPGNHTVEVKNIDGGWGVGWLYLEGFMITDIMPGDINGHDRVDEEDLSALQSHLLKKTELTDAALAAADINRDGSVDILDLLVIKTICVSPVINVVSFGADNTGTADNTGLLTSLHSLGREVYYPNGTYLFNGKTLDFSGGVEFESMSGVTVRNSLTATNIINFDDSGNLIGLMQNHLEVYEGNRDTIAGSLVMPPVSTRPINTKVDVIGYWYNDFGLQSTAPAGGWMGWHYWTWNHHDSAQKPGPSSSPTLASYDPTRHPLLGYYMGDTIEALDWQAYWLREYGLTGTALVTNSSTGLSGWENPKHQDYWIYQLLNNSPNFKNLKYVMTGDFTVPIPSSYNSSVEARVRNKFFELADKVYSKYDNYYYVEKNGKRYPVISILHETEYQTMFNGLSNLKSFYADLAAKFQSYGFGGIALYASFPLNVGDMSAQGVLHYNTSYTSNFATSFNGSTYQNVVNSFNPSSSTANDILTVATSLHSQKPHGSNWVCPGNTPELFDTYVSKAVTRLVNNPSLPQTMMVYNISEWAEGGAGLIPNVQNRFGYLEAIRNNVVQN